MTPEQELVWKLIDQTITSEEFPELEESFLADSELRRYYQDCLEESETFAQISGAEKTEAKRPCSFLLHWIRQGYAAAIGLLAGVLSTAAVFGFVVPKVTEVRPTLVSVMRDAFEDPNQTFNRGIARYANEWFFHGEVEVLKNIPTPVSGDHVLKLTPNPERKKGQVHYLIDLYDYPEVIKSDKRIIRVGSHFHMSGEGDGGRCSIRIGAFAEPPEEVGAIWAKPSQIQDRALQQVSRRTVKSKSELGWKELTTEMSIPEGTRTVIVGISAGKVPNGFNDGGRYLDAVSMQFVVDSPAPISQTLDQ